jgi:hypothetical protein
MSNNNNDEKRLSAPKVTEDGPMMRSVAIMSPQPSAMLNRPDRLPFLEAKKPMFQSRPQLKQMNIEKSKPLEETPWKVTKALPIPPLYRMDRSHTKVSESAQVVSKRISDCFFKASIAATYDDEQVCETCMYFCRYPFRTEFNKSHPPP